MITFEPLDRFWHTLYQIKALVLRNTPNRDIVSYQIIEPVFGADHQNRFYSMLMNRCTALRVTHGHSDPFWSPAVIRTHLGHLWSFGPIWVNQGHSWPIWVTHGHSDPFGSSGVIFYSFGSPTVIRTHLGYFWPIWVTHGHSDPFGSFLTHLGHPRSFGPIWVNRGHFWLIWVTRSHSNPFGLFLTHLGHPQSFKPIWLFRPIWVISPGAIWVISTQTHLGHPIRPSQKPLSFHQNLIIEDRKVKFKYSIYGYPIIMFKIKHLKQNGPRIGYPNI